MGAKSWNAKLLVDSPATKAALDRNVAIWNAGCRLICLSLLAMRRCETGTPERDAWDYITAKSGNWHLLYWLTAPPDPTKESEDVQRKVALANALVESSGGFDERLVEARRMLGVHWQQAIKASIERVKSYEAKLRSWAEEHDVWLQRRADWETANYDYMQLRPAIDEFMKSEGAIRGSRIRWNKWLSFLSSPAVVKWQNADAEFVSPSADELAIVRRSRRHAVRLESELVFDKNPQLAAFNKLHGAYEREFVRTYAKRKHRDGFRQRPTFTLPSLPSRPDWPRFQRNQNWQSLDLKDCSIALRLLGEDGKNFWCKLRFVSDPRFQEIRKLEEPVKLGRTKYEYTWRTPTGQTTSIEPQGGKLIVRPNGYFLGLSFDVQPPASRIPFDQTAASKYSTRWARDKFREVQPGAEIVSCAVDLAIRHLGAVSIATEGVVTTRRIMHDRIVLPNSTTAINVPSLSQIAQVQRQLRRSRRKSGKPAPNKKSCRRLQEHYRHLQEDRYKKAAAALCAFASHYGADFLVFEDLKQLVPDAANERGVNSALSRWNRGAIVDFAAKIAEVYGLRVVKVPAFHTSRICARCNGVGHRFEQGTKRPFRMKRSEFQVRPTDRTSVRLAFLGTWFYCPNCRRRVHADINASENLHRVFLGTFPQAKRDGDSLLVNGERVNLAEVKATVEQQLLSSTFGKVPF